MNLLIIQAHIGSTRLPGKVMRKLCDKEVLYHVYHRCTKAKTVDKIVIATSKNKENDIIEEFCKKNNIKCFRGSEEDVLDRYYQCAIKYNPDIIIRVTSDCPLLEPKLIDYWVENLKNDNVEFVKEEEELYTGFGLDIFTMTALEKLKLKSTKDKQKEHVIGYYLDNPEAFTKNKYFLPKNLEYLYRTYRLTLDTLEDYEILCKIYSMFCKNGYVELKNAIEYIDKNKDILTINNKISQNNYFEQQ